ncbi:hypothetical protein DYB30_003710 [Aphanomyces astaci]|uniref:non-specific serine/threonine protein kinase n=1 Tax=Aphanomyces astaci TaxID=112090 RepID=A0A397DUC1_APHAT|nr:hypothetical protein DYB30_003710 [Aphanomyces astaci]
MADKPSRSSTSMGVVDDVVTSSSLHLNPQNDLPKTPPDTTTAPPSIPVAAALYPCNDTISPRSKDLVLDDESSTEASNSSDEREPDYEDHLIKPMPVLAVCPVDVLSSATMPTYDRSPIQSFASPNMQPLPMNSPTFQPSVLKRDPLVLRHQYWNQLGINLSVRDLERSTGRRRVKKEGIKVKLNDSKGKPKPTNIFKAFSRWYTNEISNSGGSASDAALASPPDVSGTTPPSPPTVVDDAKDIVPHWLLQGQLTPPKIIKDTSRPPRPSQAAKSIRFEDEADLYYIPVHKEFSKRQRDSMCGESWPVIGWTALSFPALSFAIRSKFELHCWMSSSAGGTKKTAAAAAPAKLKASKPKAGSTKQKEKAPKMPSLEEDETEDDVTSSPTHKTEASTTKNSKKKGHAGSDDSSSASSHEDDASSSESEEEEEGSYKVGGYHRVNVGDVYNDRFTVLEKLGWGHFSTVWRCRDAETGQDVAMKVQKSASHYMEAARDEVDLLECVNEAATKSGGAYPRIVKLIASFEHVGPHGTRTSLYMLGDNLLTLIKRYDYKGIPIPLLKVMTKQMLEGMAFLHDQCKIIHTDLKPENVLLNAPLMKMPPFRSVAPADYGGAAVQVDPATLNADERKKLKRKLKRQKQKQLKKDTDKTLADQLERSLRVDDDDIGDDVVEAPPAARTDDLLLSNFSIVRPSAPCSNDVIAAPLQPQETVRENECTSTPATVLEPLAATLLHYCNDRRDLPAKVDAAIGIPPSTSGIPPIDGSMSLWRLELDARYVLWICRLLESTWPGRLAFLNVRPSAAYVIPGFHFPAPDIVAHERRVLQGMYLASTTFQDACGAWHEVAPLSHRVEKTWQYAVLARYHAARTDAVPDYQVKIADLGNACWTYKHFTQDIQTRQYRSPEVILGQNYDQSTDMWSMGCFVFELATGELLFDPKSSKSYSRDEDHLAQMIELLGRIPKTFASNGKFSSEYFNRKGELKKIHNLKYWALKDVLAEKYELGTVDADAFAAFLETMLRFQPSKRITASEVLNHPWLNTP